jgi:phosphonate transport system ATP-binding protein
MRLSLHKISVRHPAARTGSAMTLRDLSLDVQPGERVAVIGPSGAGKTTLLQVAAAALRPQAGAVQIGGVDPWALSGRDLRRLRARLFLAPQVPPLPPRQRVVTSVLAGKLPTMSLAASLRSLFYPSDIAGAHAALARLDVEDKLFERVDRLSGGERQRVGLARAFTSHASLWLVDEPLSALDPTRARQVIDALVDTAQARQLTLVTCLHQVDVALARFDRVVGLRAGQLVFDHAAALVTPAMLADLYDDEDMNAASIDLTSAPSLDGDGAPTPVVMYCR